MPRSAAWMNRSCAIVRPDTRIVVCSRCSRVNSRGTASNQCFAVSTGRPRRLRSSISNFLSSASIASRDIESRLEPPSLFVVLIVFSFSSSSVLGPHHVESRRLLHLRLVGCIGLAPHGDLLGQGLDL